MEENKDIDNLFKSADGFRMQPSEKVWAGLDKQLADKKPAGFWGGGARYIYIAAAVLLISFGVYKFLAPPADDKRTAEAVAVTATNTKAEEERTKVQPGSAGDGHAGMANEAVAAKAMQADVVPAVDAKASAVKKEKVAEKDEVGRNTMNAGKANASRKPGRSIADKEKAAPAKDDPSSAKDDASAGRYSAKVERPQQDAAAASGEGEDALANTSWQASAADFDSEEETEANDCKTSQAAATATTAAAAAVVPPVVAAKGAAKRFSIEAFYAPEITGRKGVASGQSTSTTTTEDFSSSYSTGAQIRFDLGDRWSIALGASYSTLDYSATVLTSYDVPQPDSSGNKGGWPIHGGAVDPSITQHFKDPHYFERYFTTGSDNTVQYNSTLGSIHLHGTPAVPAPANSKPGDIVNFKTNTLLTLQYINVPLSVRYKISKDKLDYYATAGVAMNFLMSKKATINIGDAYVETTTEIDGLEKTNLGWLFGAGVQYHLNDRFGIYLEPCFRGALTPVNDDAENKVYPYHIGAKAGISYHF